MKAIEDSHFNTSDIVHVLDVFFSCHRTQCVFCSLSEKKAEKSLQMEKTFSIIFNLYHLVIRTIAVELRTIKHFC